MSNFIVNSLVCNLYKYLKHIVFKIHPEIAHSIAINMIKNNFLIDKKIHEYFKPYLSQNYFGIEFDSPIGLAAGFDKNGETVGKIHMNGFGFIEIGTTTPLPQDGNPKPRLFRSIKEEGLINRLGFNNDGIDKLIKNVRRNDHKLPIGINIGPNKNSKDFIQDYLILLEKVYYHRSLFKYITINISSPNTIGLRNLQQVENLTELLGQISKKIEGLVEVNNNVLKLPLFIKISPDLNENDISDIVNLTLKQNISGLVVSNTTIDKSNIDDRLKHETGGLSGRPLFDKSNKLLSEIYKITQNKILLVGVGGISSAEDVITKMRAGASLVQLYTAMIYQGLFLADKINRNLVIILQNEGIKNIREIIGK